MGATKAKAPPSPNAVKVSPALADGGHKFTSDEPARRSSTDYGFSDSTIADCDSTDSNDRKKAAGAVPRKGSGINADSDNTTKKAAKPLPSTSTSSVATPPRPKTDDPKFRQARPPHASLTSSQSRVESFKSHGLSELSKQIRIAHAKNTAMASEIERLERQLTILAELKGVSISELRDALGRACAGEAHADMRTQINKLRSELEAAELINQGKAGGGGGGGTGGANAGGDTGDATGMDRAHDSAGTIMTANAQAFEKEASDKAIANLQLRVGELEEVETMLRSEIADLYDELRGQKAQEATLKSKLSSKEAQIEELLKSLQVADEEKERQQNKAQEAYASKEDESSAELSAARKAQARAEMEAMKFKSRIRLLEESLRAAQLEGKMKADEAALLQKRLAAREKDLQLKTDQYNSRSAQQDARIKDLELQMASLYAAFGLVQEDRGTETARLSEFEHYLNDADTELARQLNETDGTPGSPAVAVPAGPLPVGSKVIVNTPEHSGKRGVVVSEVEGGGSGEQHVYLEESDQTLSVIPACLTPEASVAKPARVVPSSSPAGREFNNKILASGYLLKRGQGPMKKWNRRYMVLRGSYGIYQLLWGESAGSRAKGTIGIATGVSTVTKTKQFANGGHRYSFVLSANPQDPKAPVFVACASSKADLEMWMNSLLYCCKGIDAQGSNLVPLAGSGHGNSTSNQEMRDQEMARRLAQSGSEFA